MSQQLLQDKHILLGISGGIAAYKCGELIRQFVKAGAEVKVIITQGGLQFITPLTLQTLSKNQIYSDVFDEKNPYTTEHVALSDWGDCLVVAPASADILGKFAHGIADDALSTTFLAFDKPVFLAPAMNTRMYHHPMVQKNLRDLEAITCQLIPVGEGELACGVTGQGRMAEPIDIMHFVAEHL